MFKFKTMNGRSLQILYIFDINILIRIAANYSKLLIQVDM